MKFFLRSQPAKFHRLGVIKITVLGVLMGLAILCSTGCGKKKSEAPPVDAQPAAAEAPSPTQPPRSSTEHLAVAPLATPTGEPDMAELNRTLLRWVLGHRKKPASFDEFAASANVPIPPPPAGKKYAIDGSMHIVLVKQ